MTAETGRETIMETLQDGTEIWYRVQRGNRYLLPGDHVTLYDGGRYVFLHGYVPKTGPKPGMMVAIRLVNEQRSYYRLASMDLIEVHHRRRAA